MIEKKKQRLLSYKGGLIIKTFEYQGHTYHNKDLKGIIFFSKTRTKEENLNDVYKDSSFVITSVYHVEDFSKWTSVGDIRESDEGRTKSIIMNIDDNLKISFGQTVSVPKRK